MVSQQVRELEQENQELKLKIEKLQELCEEKATQTKNCEYCSHFMQHYVFTDGHYSPTCAGHCVVGNRTKSRRTEDTCKFFEKKAYGKNLI